MEEFSNEIIRQFDNGRMEWWNDGMMERWKIGVKPTRFAKPVRFFQKYKRIAKAKMNLAKVYYK